MILVVALALGVLPGSVGSTHTGLVPSIVLLAPVTGLRPAADDPSSDQARTWLREELAQPEYRESWWDRFWSWLGDLVAIRPSGVAAATPWPLILAGVTALAVLAAVVWWSRRRRRPVGEDDEGVLGPDRHAAERYRRRARQLAERGEHSAAFLEIFRALTAQGVERDLVRDAPGSTAAVVGRELATRFPDLGERVFTAATLFDVVRYGGGRAAEEDFRDAADLDARLVTAEPVMSAAADRSPAVPR